MKRLYWVFAAAALALAPLAAHAQSSWSASSVGVGPHGFDWEIGTWSCTNSSPSPYAGPSTATLTVTRSGGVGTLAVTVGKNFSSAGYNQYVAKTKSWVSPYAETDGSYGVETTSPTGEKIVWAGSFVDGTTGKTIRNRDRLDYASATKYVDVGQFYVDGAWKTQYTITCTKNA